MKPQPWQMYTARNMITSSDYPQLISDELLPFQIISEGDFVRAEIAPHGSGSWQQINITANRVVIDSLYYISYAGGQIACGVYDFRVITDTEMWWFEPIIIEEFTISTVSYSARDELMLPLKFSGTQHEGIPLIAPCDSFLPFMFRTPNPTSGSIRVYLYDRDSHPVNVTSEIDINVVVIDGHTYYIHEGECRHPFIDCGLHRLEIVDGENSYMSVWFDVECEIEDIPDGSRPMKDIDGRVIRNEYGDIQYESCLLD